MSLELIEKAGILDNALEKLVLDTIGDGSKDTFIEINDNFREIILNNMLDISNALKLGECEIDGIKAIRKIGAVYLSDNIMDFIEKNNKIYSIVPAFKYSKNDTQTTTLEHITVYGQYKLIVKSNNVDKYELIIVSYTEAL